MVEAGYQTQLRALEVYWTLQGDEDGPPAQASGGPAAVPSAGQEPLPRGETARRKSASEVDADVRETFPLFPETYTRHEVCRALGYVPYRGALYLSLQKLVKEGFARILTEGEGRKAAVYRKTGAGDPPRSE